MTDLFQQSSQKLDAAITEIQHAIAAGLANKQCLFETMRKLYGEGSANGTWSQRDPQRQHHRHHHLRRHRSAEAHCPAAPRRTAGSISRRARLRLARPANAARNLHGGSPPRGADQLRADLPLPSRDARGAARRDRRQHPAGGMIASRVRRVLTHALNQITPVSGYPGRMLALLRKTPAHNDRDRVPCDRTSPANLVEPSHRLSGGPADRRRKGQKLARPHGPRARCGEAAREIRHCFYR